METRNIISVHASINVPVDKVWKLFTTPGDIVEWNNASEDWHTTRAENDLRKGGKFVSRMEAKDGSMGFDFGGTYDNINPNRQIDYTIGDGRKVRVVFTSIDNRTEVTETFEAEETNPVEMQRTGWQAMLNNFRKYAEKTYSS